MNKELITLKREPYIIKNKYSTIDFFFIFPALYKKEYMFYLLLLKQILLNSSFLYKNEKMYKRKWEDLMIISESLTNKILNNNLYLEFRLTVPNPKVIKNYDLERAFSFFVNTIYKPNIVGNKFNKKVFERERTFLKEDILMSLKNVYSESYQKFLNLVDDKGILKDNIYNNLDLIKNANEYELYDVYNELIINNKPIIMVYGDVDKSIVSLIKKYVNIKNEKVKLNIDYYNFLFPSEKCKYVIENSKYNQSILYVAYKVKKMNNNDLIYLNLIKNILGIGAESLIFKTLRVDSGLVYSCSTWCDSITGLLVIETYINNNSNDIVLEKIKNLIDMLKNKEILRKEIYRVLESLKYSVIRKKDNKNKKLDDFIKYKFKFGFTIEKLIEKYSNLDLDLTIDFINRLVLDTVYFYKGDFNEKNKNI